MKTRVSVLYLVLLFTCLVAFVLPYLIVGSTSQKLYAADLKLPKFGSATPTFSTERALTVEAFESLFSTAIHSATATLTSTSAPSPSPVFTLTLSPTPMPSRTPTIAPSPTRIPPTITGRPRERDTPISPPPDQPPPTNPPPTNPPPTNPPKTEPPPTSPPPTEPPPPTNPPILPPIISTILPPLP